MHPILTKRGYSLYDVASALQKTIRRGDAKLAGYFAQELFASGYSKYCWKRLLTISAEDCHGDDITTEIWNLFQSFKFVNESAKSEKGRIFISKAVIILCRTGKNRDPDVLQNLVYDKKHGVSDSEIEESLALSDSMGKPELPDYTFDCHTLSGKRAGKTKDDFFLEEFLSLTPRQPGLFDSMHDDVRNGTVSLA